MIQAGKYKVWLNRVQTYVAPLNFSMILYLYIITEPLGIVWQVWVVLLIVILLSVLSLDMLFIFPGELRYTTEKNPVMMDIKQDLKEIRRELQSIKEKIG